MRGTPNLTPHTLFTLCGRFTEHMLFVAGVHPARHPRRWNHPSVWRATGAAPCWPGQGRPASAAVAGLGGVPRGGGAGPGLQLGELPRGGRLGGPLPLRPFQGFLKVDPGGGVGPGGGVCQTSSPRGVPSGGGSIPQLRQPPTPRGTGPTFGRSMLGFTKFGASRILRSFSEVFNKPLFGGGSTRPSGFKKSLAPPFTGPGAPPPGVLLPPKPVRGCPPVASRGRSHMSPSGTRDPRRRSCCAA